ncbi:MAG: FHA domain-containing protein, partial [Thiothrix litoralis]
MGEDRLEGIQVTLLQAGQVMGDIRHFTQGFRAGRALDNDVMIPFNVVSRYHLEVKREDDVWWLYDLNSANGLFIQDDRVLQRVRLALPVEIRLGDSACFLRLETLDTNVLPHDHLSPVQPNTVAAGQAEASLAKTTTRPASAPPDKGSVSVATKSAAGLSREAIRARLLAEAEADDAGDYTKMVRQLIHEDRSQRGKRYRKVILGVAALLVVSVGLVVYQQIALSKARTLAIDMFYDIKVIELNLAQAEIQMDEQAELLKNTLKSVEDDKLKAEEAKLEVARQRLTQEREKLRDMRKKYQGYVQEAKALRIHFPTATAYEQELIMRVAREFGESELEVPPGFVKEVKRYIGYWQGSPRLATAVQRLESNGHKPVVLNALVSQNLPLHFIYLPLQESNFNPQAIGPPTRYGIAKGAWQFLATTGQE